MATCNTRRNLDAEIHDYYTTPDIAIYELLEREEFNGVIFEPCCGEGHISKLLESEGHTVISHDLVDRGYGETGINYLIDKSPKYDHMITNPPYSLAKEFAEKAIRESKAGTKIAMLLRASFLESTKRKHFLEKSPLKYMYAFSKRISCGKNGTFEKGNNSVFYCWYVWEVGYTGEPMIRWI